MEYSLERKKVIKHSRIGQKSGKDKSKRASTASTMIKVSKTMAVMRKEQLAHKIFGSQKKKQETQRDKEEKTLKAPKYIVTRNTKKPGIRGLKGRGNRRDERKKKEERQQQGTNGIIWRVRKNKYIIQTNKEGTRIHKCRENYTGGSATVK